MEICAIIVIIILAVVVILILSKNNPIGRTREAKFKDDTLSLKDDLALTIAKEYTNAGGQRDEKINALSYADIKIILQVLQWIITENLLY